MRVVCLSDATLNRNGVGSYYSDLIDHLKDTIDYAELICPEENNRNRSYSYTITTSLPGDPTQRIFFPKIHSLLSRISKIKPDVIILPTPGPYGLTGFGLSKCIRANLCVGFHTQYDKLTDLYWKSMFSDISRIYMKYYNRLLFSASDVVVANSDEMVRRAAADGAHKIQMIGTPVAKAFLDRPSPPLPREVRSVCFCGRLTGEKNISSIIAAAAHLRHIRFTIAGDGPLRDEVEAASRQHGNIHYVGWVGREDVIGVIDGSDILVLPSKVESFGTIALEAMARRRLVLVSDSCGIVNWPDLIKGIYVLRKNETLVDAIRRISMTDFQERLGKMEIAYKAARAFNTFTIRQWTDLFTSISMKSSTN